MTKTPLTILLAAPRGFCAGVDRAIQIVEVALERFGAPVYVRHEIVHNRFVVQSLEAKGAVFVDELDQVPDGVPVVFSAHGVPKSVPAAAERRGLFYLDATCPLVSKVHREAERHFNEGRQIVLIGHAGHPEVIGTMGQLPEGAVVLVETVDDVATVEIADPDNLAYATQTTLSVDETAGILAALQARFPNIAGPKKEDICYATTNRQQAVRPSRRRWTRCWCWAPPTPPTPSGWSRWRRSTAAPRPSWSSGRPTSTGRRWTASGRSASPPARRLRRFWWRRLSTPPTPASP